MKLVIAIPVHESYDCIINHLDNIKKYVSSCVAVVLHVSGDAPGSDFLYDSLVLASKIKYNGFLFVNPTRYKTHKAGEAGNVTGLASVDCINYRYIKSKIDFDVFSIATSNELFVREGLDAVVHNAKSQFNVLNAPNMVSERRGHPTDLNTEAGYWANILKNKYNCEYPEMGWVVGSLLPCKVWDAVSKIVLDDFEPLLHGHPLGLEEYVIPTLIFNLFPELYEEIIPKSFVLCPQDYDPYAQAISESLVLSVRNGDFPNVYAVKRVPRDINHPIRVFINNI